MRPTRIRDKKMNWLWIILIVGIIVAVIAYINTGDKGEAAGAGLSAALGCGGVIFQILLWGLGLFLLIKLFSWLF